MILKMTEYEQFWGGEGLRMDFELKKHWEKNFYLKSEIDNINLLVL